MKKRKKRNDRQHLPKKSDPLYGSQYRYLRRELHIGHLDAKMRTAVESAYKLGKLNAEQAATNQWEKKITKLKSVIFRMQEILWELDANDAAILKGSLAVDIKLASYAYSAMRRSKDWRHRKMSKQLWKMMQSFLEVKSLHREVKKQLDTEKKKRSQ